MFLKFGELYLLGDLQSSGKPKQDKNKVTCKAHYGQTAKIQS